jgi:hypothetical protein
MNVSTVILFLMQLPYDTGFPQWVETLGDTFKVLFALAIRGYLIFLLLGLMVYATGLNDGLSKALITLSIFLYFVAPFLINLFAGFAGTEPITLEDATRAWLETFGLTDSELVNLLVTIGECVAAICVLIGAILYFTPSSNNLKAKGRSLIVRSLILAPILIFFQLTPWL